MKISGRFLILLFACAGWMQSQGQQAKNTVQLADQYFAAGEYYTAARLYGQVLDPSKNQSTTGTFPLNIKGRRTALAPAKGTSTTDILYKQAESYRLAHYWKEAAAAYKECATKNLARYGDALYWYGVCLRSLGDYAAAEENVKHYLRTARGNIKYKEAALKELQTLQYIREQLARPDSALRKVQKLDAVNSSEKGVYAPVHVSGNRFLVSSTATDSVKVNGVNPHHSRLFYATLNNGSLEDMTPAAMPATDPMINQGAAAVSADGKYLYFSQWKKEKDNTSSSIYYSVKQGDGWSVPTLLPSVNLSGHNSKQPFCTADGKYLFFASDRPGGAGNFDIWYAPLKPDGTTGAPVNAGKVINTTGDEQTPFYQTSSATLVFSSNGKAGMGGYDLFAATGSGTNWGMAENLGYPVNSTRDDVYFFTPENASLLSNAVFSSDRGTGCCLETYRLTKIEKSKRMTGVVRDCKDNKPVAKASIVMKDGSGKIWNATTGDDGKYMFEIGTGTYPDLSLTVNKEFYKQTVVSAKVEKTDESDLLTDILINTDACIEKKPLEETLVIKVEDVVTVYFDFDKSILKPATISKMDSIYQVMLKYPATTIQISGYTDGRGTNAYNKVLSDKRARACAEYLIKKGIDADRIAFVSFGACCPVEMELINGRDNPDGRSRNRRALINVKKD